MLRIANITWVDPDLRINAIREIRAATGYTLRQAKTVYDSVREGAHYTVTLRPGETFVAAQYVGTDDDFSAPVEVAAQPEADLPSTAQVSAFLNGLPEDMTIGHLRATLKALQP